MSALGPMAGPPPGALPLPPGLAGGPGDGDPGGGDEDAREHSALKAAGAALQAAMNAETDPKGKAVIAGLIQGVHKLLADHQDQVHQAMGMPGELKAVMGMKQAAGR